MMTKGEEMKRRLVKGCICLLALFILAVPTRASMKERIQKKINVKNTQEQSVQYQPYYLESNYQAKRDQESWGEGRKSEVTVQTAEPLQQAPMPTPVRKRCDSRVMAGECNAAPLTVPNFVEPNPNFIVYNVSYVGELEENVATVNGEILFEVFDQPNFRPAEIPLVSDQVGLIDVKVNRGKSFVMSRGGKYHLVIDKPGRYTLNIEYLLKVKRERENGPGSFQVDVMPAPISQFEFIIPEDVEVFIDPAIKVETLHAENRTEAWAVMPNTNSIEVRWTKALPKTEIETVELAPKLYAETSTYAAIGGGVIECHSEIQFSILQAEVSHLQIAVPDDVSILSVNSKELRDWKASKKDNIQYLDVFLNFGTKGQHVVDVTFERNVDESTQVVEMPWIRAMGVERENGFYGIAASTNLEIDVGKSDRVTRIDSKQLPPYIWQQANRPILLAFKYLNNPISIEVEMTRHEELPVLVAAIDSSFPETLLTKDGRALTKLVYHVRNNVKQYLRIKLPEKATVWSSFVDGNPVKPAKDKDGNVLISLKKSQHGGNDVTQFPVEVVYLDEAKPVKGWGKAKLTLPAVDLPVNQLNWTVYLPDDFIYYDIKTDGEISRQPHRGRGGISGLGIQGRLRMAADDIGEQYEQYAQQVSYEAEGKVADGFISEKSQGLLPIKIDLPMRGNGVGMSKLLVIEGDKPWMSVRHMPWGPAAQKTVKVIKVILFIGVLTWLIVRLRHRKHKKQRA